MNALYQAVYWQGVALRYSCDPVSHSAALHGRPAASL